MDGPPDISSGLREFRVVCRGNGMSAYIVHRSAVDAAAAMEGVRAAGHDPLICMPFGLSRSDEHRIIGRMRFRERECSNCGYDLSGQPRGPVLVCPECGLGSAPASAGVPRCAECGYCLAGIAVGAGPMRCPECGSTNPFLERR